VTQITGGDPSSRLSAAPAREDLDQWIESSQSSVPTQAGEYGQPLSELWGREATAAAMGAHKKTSQSLGGRGTAWPVRQAKLTYGALMDAGRSSLIGVDADIGPKLPLYQQLASRDCHREKITIQDLKLL
jgi:hypothetical protein